MKHNFLKLNIFILTISKMFGRRTNVLTINQLKKLHLLETYLTLNLYLLRAGNIIDWLSEKVIYVN